MQEFNTETADVSSWRLGGGGVALAATVFLNVAVLKKRKC